MNVLFQIIDGFIHLQNYQSFTMKLLSCYQQRTEKIIKSNIAVLFSFHLAALLIETDANVEPISLHFWTNYKAGTENKIDKDKSCCSELRYHLCLCSKEI